MVLWPQEGLYRLQKSRKIAISHLPLSSGIFSVSRKKCHFSFCKSHKEHNCWSNAHGSGNCRSLSVLLHHPWEVLFSLCGLHPTDPVLAVWRTSGLNQGKWLWDSWQTAGWPQCKACLYLTIWYQNIYLAWPGWMPRPLSLLEGNREEKITERLIALYKKVEAKSE